VLWNDMSKINEVQQEIQNLISEYASIRQKFEKVKQKHPEYLEGNDNYIGIIGEYWATLFLREKYGKKLDKFIKGKVQQAKAKQDNQKIEAFEVGGVSYSNSTEWLDFVVEHDEAKKDYEFISVKAISSERNDQTSGYIKNKKCEKNEILSILILKLDEDLLPEELLYIQDVNSNLRNGKKDYKDRWDKGYKINFRCYDDGFDDVFINDIYQYEDDKFIPKIKS